MEVNVVLIVGMWLLAVWFCDVLNMRMHRDTSLLARQLTSTLAPMPIFNLLCFPVSMVTEMGAFSNFYPCRSRVDWQAKRFHPNILSWSFLILMASFLSNRLSCLFKMWTFVSWKRGEEERTSDSNRCRTEQMEHCHPICGRNVGDTQKKFLEL